MSVAKELLQSIIDDERFMNECRQYALERSEDESSEYYRLYDEKARSLLSEVASSYGK